MKIRKFALMMFVFLHGTHAAICELYNEEYNIFIAPLCPISETIDEWGWDFFGT